MYRLAALRANARARNCLGIIAHLTGEVSEHARPRIAVAALRCQHIDRLLDLPTVDRGVDLTDTQIAEGLFGIVINCAQLFELGHLIVDHARNRLRKQLIELFRTGGVTAVAVKFQAVYRLVVIELLCVINVEQQTADIMPAGSQHRGLLVVRRPCLARLGLFILMVGRRLKHGQICPVRVRHVRHNTDALTGRSSHHVACSIQDTVEHGHDFGARNRVVRTEQAGRVACDPALCQRGLHRVVRPVRLGHVGKAALRTDIIMRDAGQDGDKLGAGDISLRPERAILITADQRIAGHFANRLSIPSVKRHIGEQIISAARGFGQQGRDQLARLSTRDRRIRAECAVLITVHVLHMVNRVEHRRFHLRHILRGGRAGRYRQRSNCHQCGEGRRGHLLFHGKTTPFHQSVHLDGARPHSVPHYSYFFAKSCFYLHWHYPTPPE